MIAETTGTSRPGLDSRQSFQELKTRLHRQVVDSIDLSKAGELPEAKLRQQLQALSQHICSLQQLNLAPRDRDAMVQEIMNEIYGFGPLQPLMDDPEISDVLVNGSQNVHIERSGLLMPTDVKFANDTHLLEFIQRLVGRAGRRIDEVSPMVDCKLPDGSRLNAVIPPLALRGPTLSIRRFKTKAMLFDDMVRIGSLAPEMAEFLKACVKARLNILISGGTGAGKTTMLNNMSRYISATERVITIEQTAELQLQQADVVSLEMRPPNVEGKGSVDQRDLLRNSLRMRPDRIIVGEARGGEVFELLQAMNTGHDGSMSTVHANDTREALSRLEVMIALSGIDLPVHVSRQYIASAVQILVHIGRLGSGERKVTRVSELSGVVDGAYQLEDVFVYRQLGLDDAGRLQGAFYATGHSPMALQRIEGAGMQLPPGLFSPRELTITRS
jgi:pilus assembly protein CpaF